MIHHGRHIRVELEDQIATLRLAVAGSAANSLSWDILDDLEAALGAIEARPHIDVLVVRGRGGAFATGPTADDWLDLADADLADRFARRGQLLCQRLSDLPASTVAVIDGSCAGVGAELATACDFRVGVDRPATRIDLRAGDLGLIPCWGTTVRLPRILGPGRALRLMLGESPLSVIQAQRLGLIDEAGEPKNAEIRLRALVDSLQDSPRRPGPRVAWWRRMAEAWPAGGGALRTAVRTGQRSEPDGLAAERQTLRNLLSSADARRRLEAERYSRLPLKVFPEPINPVPPTPDRVGLVGGGELGTALAVKLAVAGKAVTVQEVNDDAAAAFETRLSAAFDAEVAAGRLSPSAAAKSRGRVSATVTWRGFGEAGWAIECVDEDLGLKRGVFAEFEDRCRPRVPLTTASTTLRVEAIQAELSRPGRVAGLHWLPPSGANALVVVAGAPATEPDTLVALEAWSRSLGLTPVLVGDRPGRVVTRIQMAYLSEAVQLVSEGLPPADIDRRVREFGMTAGPLEWIDGFGFDRLAALGEDVRLARGDDFAANLSLEPLRSAGFRGRPNGEGFYRHGRASRRPNHLARMLLWQTHDEHGVRCHYVFDPEESLREGVRRLVLRAINEAAACLGDEQAAGPEGIDLAVARGAGWAPGRGGPLRLADDTGLAQIVEELTRFADRFGPRFAPCLELQRRAEAGESFYGEAVASVPEAVVQ